MSFCNLVTLVIAVDHIWVQAREEMQASSIAGRKDIGECLQLSIKEVQRTGKMHSFSFSLPASER